MVTQVAPSGTKALTGTMASTGTMTSMGTTSTGTTIDRGVHGRFGFGPVLPYYGYYPYDAGSAYCTIASYGAYYPNVPSCPETWCRYRLHDAASERGRARDVTAVSAARVRVPRVERPRMTPVCKRVFDGPPLLCHFARRTATKTKKKREKEEKEKRKKKKRKKKKNRKREGKKKNKKKKQKEEKEKKEKKRNKEKKKKKKRKDKKKKTTTKT